MCHHSAMEFLWWDSGVESVSSARFCARNLLKGDTECQPVSDWARDRGGRGFVQFSNEGCVEGVC